MIYYLEVSANTCRCTIIINGLGIDELDASKVGSVQYPCNTELVGKSNMFEVAIMPVSLDLATFNKIQVACTVKKYGDNDFIGPESGEVVKHFTLEQTIEEIKSDPRKLLKIADLVPFKISAEFDSEDVPSFENRLLKTKLIENVEALKDWAMTFRSYLEMRNNEALFALYEPKLNDYDIAFPNDKEPNNKVWFENWMKNKIFPQTPYVGFKREDLVLKKWCEGLSYQRTQNFCGCR